MLWRWHVPLFLLFAITSVYGTVMIETPFNAPFHWVGRWLSAPVLLGGWLYAWTQRWYFLEHRRVSLGRFLFCAVASPLILLLFSAGLASLLNASFSTDRTVRFEGLVTRLDALGGKHVSHVVTLQDEKTRQEVRLETDKTSYRSLQDRLREGKKPRFQRDMRVGLLGIPFRWK